MRPVLIAAAVLALATGAAHAQQQGPSLDHLHDSLRLSPQQEAAWRAYAAAIAPDPQQEGRARQAQMLMPTLPTPRRLALMRAQMQSDLVVFEHDAQAVNAFYEQLSLDQQRIFDSQTAPTATPR